MVEKKTKKAAHAPTGYIPSHNKRLLYAYWENWHKGVIVLQRDWRIRFRQPSIFFNPGKRHISKLRKAPPFDFALLSGYCLEGGSLHFILNTKRYPHQIDKRESYYIAGDFNGWADAIGNPDWELTPTRVNDINCLGLSTAPKNCFIKDPVKFKFVSESGRWLEPPKEALNATRDENGVRNYELNPMRTGQHRFYFEVEGDIETLGKEEILWQTNAHEESCPIDFGRLILSFKTDLSLGAQAKENQTTFRIFAPRATQVYIHLSHETSFNEKEILPMELKDRVVWETSYPKNLHGYYYYYQIEGRKHFQLSHFDQTFKVLDPYAVATLTSAGPGIIIDPKNIEQLKKTSFKTPHWHDLVIWETHIRDLLTHAPIQLTDQERLGFKGLAKWIRSDDCYIKKLGINAIEFLPIQEFDAKSREEYHWGYMPTNYFSPSSNYASNPAQATQIEEFQDLVAACHEARLAVIMDVVYNHVGDPNHLLFIDKYHYFEVNAEGYLMNYSGCGNDLRTQAPMTKRLIIDSLKHLIKVYDVDGFRFDLAELIGIETLLEIENELKKVKPSIILIAEPWSFRNHIGHELKETGFASWNDGYRKFIADYVKGQSNHEAFSYFVQGSLGYLSRFPAQSVNYGSSHDDLCWLDKITENPHHNGFHPTIRDRRRTHLMVSLLMCSLGIPMIAQGTEILHSKTGVNNTYQRGDLNALQYTRAVEYANTFSYFKKWINFRLSSHGALLRLEHKPDQNYIKIHFAPDSSAAMVVINSNFSLGSHQIIYGINPHEWTSIIPRTNIVWEKFLQIADHERFNLEGLQSSLIPIEDTCIHLPPLSCGLWISK